MSLERLLKKARKSYPELSSSDVSELLSKRVFTPFDNYLGYEIHMRDPDGQNSTLIAVRHERRFYLAWQPRMREIIRADTNDYWKFRLLFAAKGPEYDYNNIKAYFAFAVATTDNSAASGESCAVPSGSGQTQCRRRDAPGAVVPCRSATRPGSRVLPPARLE